MWDEKAEQFLEGEPSGHFDWYNGLSVRTVCADFLIVFVLRSPETGTGSGY
jgi:hypothetical protein